MFNVNLTSREKDQVCQSRMELCQRASIEAPQWDVDLHDGDSAPSIFVTLDADVLENHSERTVCTATVKLSDNRTAVVHFSIRVADGKVRGKITAGGKSHDTDKTVNVPVWSRSYVKGN